MGRRAAAYYARKQKGRVMNCSPSQFVRSELTLVDIGSRNGITDLQSIADLVVAYGFEPSQEEYQKLVREPNDKANARHVYREERYYPYAIAAASGPCPLYITNGPGCTSTLRPNTPFVNRFRRDAWNKKFDIIKTEEVPARTLSEFIAEARLSRIDLLKLDTQGNEFDILNDKAVLSCTSIVKTEVEFIPMYTGQKLYQDLSALMSAHGFLQFDLRFDKIHYRGLNPDNLAGGVLAWADAYFINESIMGSEAGRAQILVLLDMGNDDLALDVARRTRAADDSEFFALRSWYLAYRQSRLTLRQRLQRSLERRLGLRVSRITP
jgi:FkbM family methyltransferase